MPPMTSSKLLPWSIASRSLEDAPYLNIVASFENKTREYAESILSMLC